MASCATRTVISELRLGLLVSYIAFSGVAQMYSRWFVKFGINFLLFWLNDSQHSHEGLGQ